MNTSLPLSMGIAVCLALAGTAASAQRAPGAPQARIDNVTEQHHGETVADPYRYMEDTKRARCARLDARTKRCHRRPDGQHRWTRRHRRAHPGAHVAGR